MVLLFKGFLLWFDGLLDYVEVVYNVIGLLLYVELVDVYMNVLNVYDVVWNGFCDVFYCCGDVVGVSWVGRLMFM